MHPRRKPREYRGNSCLRCHKQKVKCSRDSPCRNCQVANKPCVYVIRDRPVTVTESYLKTLEAAAAASTPNSIINQHYQETRPVVPNNSRIDDTETASPAPPRQPHALQVENSAAARFVSKLKEIQNPKALPNSVRQDLLLPVSGDGSTQPHIYEYFTLNSDTSHAKCTFKLPPYPYAIFLVNQFFTYVGHDWHWFRLERFRHRLENVYKIPDSAESKNRTWLCQLLVAFALGSSIRGQDPDSSPPRQNFAHAIQSIPGVEFFEQALGLLKIPYEEASVDHIETLNMVALCSHCLNRQKTTYMYAGISARMCNMLQLHETSSSMDCSPVERENCKRVWWSTFCIDRMASTQMGVLPTLQIDQGDLSYPTNEGLSGEEINEFSDPDYLTARIQLTIIQADAANGIGQSDGEDASDNDGDSYKRSIDTLLRSRLRRLQDWKAALPAHMAVDFHESIEEMKNNMALLRSLANLHLRYNQCIILLLRPLLLRQISDIVSNKMCHDQQDTVQDLNQICLTAARSSLNILIDLRTCSLLAKLGFMENMHLFSSLIILCLVRVINARRPNSFLADPSDDIAYDAGKDVLCDMAQAGSLAARGHVRMLDDVEVTARGITEVRSSTTMSDMAVEHWDADDWIMQLFESENLANLF